MNIQNEDKLILDFFTKKVLEINDITEEEIENADKLQLLYENVKLKRENLELKAQLADFENEFPKASTFAEIPKLIIDKEKKEYTFILKGVEKKAKFNPRTNESKLLLYFIDNPFVVCLDNVLEKELNHPRSQANSFSKRRVPDIIKAIRRKLGKDIIIDYKYRSYFFFATVSFI